MLDQFKMMGALAGLLRNQERIKELSEDVKQRLAEIRVSAETGGGAVRATASGTMRIVSVDIEPTMLQALVESEGDENRMLAEDLIAGAVNAALEKAQQAAQDEVAAVMGEVGLPDLPGSLGGFLGSQ